MREAGASDEEIKDSISTAISVRDSAKKVMESQGFKHLGISKDNERIESAGKTTRIKELISIAAAFAVNCTTNLEKHIAASRSVGITDNEVRSVLDAALFIKGEAAYYVSQIVKIKEEKNQLQKLLEKLQATQAQLVQSEKMAALGKLVAGFVHEMNTPIGVINSNTDLTSRSINTILEEFESITSIDIVKNNRRLQNSLEVLRNSSQATQVASERITSMVRSLKNFTRLDESIFKKADLHEGLESTLTLIKHELTDRISVVKDFGNIPLVTCYPPELNQVFMNLLSNAVHAIKNKGAITIRTFVKNENVHVEISDTGVGIPPEKMQGLFDPSFTKTSSRVKAGLGLFTSSHIIQKHHGQIKVKSEVGKGSTFTVILPLDRTKQSEEEKKSDSSSRTSRCDRLENMDHQD